MVDLLTHSIELQLSLTELCRQEDRTTHAQTDNTQLENSLPQQSALLSAVVTFVIFSDRIKLSCAGDIIYQNQELITGHFHYLHTSDTNEISKVIQYPMEDIRKIRQHELDTKNWTRHTL